MEKRKVINLIHKSQQFTILFVLIPPGKYKISNRPLLGMRNATIAYSSAYWMQDITVSMGLYEFVYGEPYYNNGLTKNENLIFPWNSMAFSEIIDFLNRLNIILRANNYDFEVDVPSISEWEHALLCGKDDIWSWGHDEMQLSDYAWFKENSGLKVNFSKQKKPNDWGLYDMYGNVGEYFYDNIFNQNESHFLNPQIEKPIVGGVLPWMGGYYESDADDCYTYNVMGYFNEYIEPTGFRLIIRNL